MPDSSVRNPELQPPSETAKVAALCRAVHARAASGRLFSTTVTQEPFLSSTVTAIFWLTSTAKRFHVCLEYPMFSVRSRFTEDELSAAIERGVTQYVILGAGLDSFAYRRPDLMEHVDVYEVNQPATQAWKRQRAAALGLAAPPRLHYVPVDFGQQSLMEGLTAAGFDCGKPVFISLLGVTQYLARQACDRLFRELSTLSPHGSTLVLEYILPTASWGENERPLLEGAVKHYTEIGEPWLTQMSRAEAEQGLRASGFADVVHLDRAAIEERYLQNREDDSAMPHFTALARAETSTSD